MRITGFLRVCGSAARYGVRGLTRLASEWWLGALGGGVGWFLLYLSGLQMILSDHFPQNALLANSVTLVLCVVSGVSCVFVTRLLYYPIGSLVSENGGWAAVINEPVKARMVSFLLMLFGIVLFVILFGTGSVLFVMRGAGLQSTVSLVTSNAADAQISLSYDDEHYREDLRKFVFSECSPLFSSYRELIGNSSVANAQKSPETNLIIVGLLEQNLDNIFGLRYSELMNYAKEDLSKIDPSELSKLTMTFLGSYYIVTSNIDRIIELWDLKNQNRKLYDEWKTVDERTMIALDALKGSNPKYLGSLINQITYSGRNRP